MAKSMLSDKLLVDEMNKFQLSRWIALFEAVNIIADKAEKNGEDFDGMSLKQTAIEDYVDAASALVYRELMREDVK